MRTTLGLRQILGVRPVSPRRRMPRAAGFTLIELMLALSLFALVSAMAYGGLRSVLDASVDTKRQAAQLAALQTAFVRLGRDLEQTVARGIRDAYGDQQPALLGGGGGSHALEFTRIGRPNPAKFPRSSLQRIAYGLREDTLIRLSWVVLDRGDERDPYEQVLMEGVKDLRFRYLNERLAWQTNWPSVGDQDPQDLLPKAVEVTLELNGIGELTRLFQVPG